MSKITSYNQGLVGDREYIFALRGRPFAMATSPTLSTLDFNLIDWALVRELNLKMSDLQCTKFYFSGHKMRILGKISTTVQCIQDGRISGNFHIKARVVEDLNNFLDTHAVAGGKLKDQLREPQQVHLTQPAQSKKKPKKERKHSTSSNKDEELPHTPKIKKERKFSTSTPPSVKSTPSHTSTASLQDVWSPTSPYTQNIYELQEMFGENTDLEKDCGVQQALLTEHDPNGQTDYGQEYQEDGGLMFNFTTTFGATFIPGHGREGCSAYACAGALHKPHNCGYHEDWRLPEDFRGCGLWCRGGFCSCLKGQRLF